MIALLIIAGIILLIVILLNFPIILDLSYISEKFDITVKYMFFTLFPMKEKPPKKPKRKKTVKKKKTLRNDITVPNSYNELNSQIEEISTQTRQNETVGTKIEDTIDPNTDKESDQSEKETYDSFKPKKEKNNLFDKNDLDDIKEKIALVKKIIISSKKGIKRILKNIRIYDIYIDFDVANEDAADAAIGYGKMNIAVFGALNFLRTFFTISLKKININCIYNSNKCRYDGSCTVKLRPATALLAGISIIYHFLVNTIKDKIKENKEAERTVNANEPTSN